MTNDPCGCGGCDVCDRARANDPDLGDNDIVQNEQDCCDLLRELLLGTPADDLTPPVAVATFSENGVLTNNKGLVLHFPNGRMFQVTVVRSR